MNLGGIIKRMRKEKEMRLVELSKKSGVALATLSRMENGKMTGTIDSHMKICEALGIMLPELYKNLYSSKNTLDMRTKKSEPEVFAHDKRSSEEILASGVSNKKMMPVLIRINRGGKTRTEDAKPGIEKFVYVLSGRIEVVIGKERYALMKGDTLYFKAVEPHFFKNHSNAESRLLCVISPPAS